MKYPVEHKYSKNVRVGINYEDFEYYVQIRFLFIWFTITVYGDYFSADLHARYLAANRGLI
jgi:hypothetical protein